MTTVSVLERLAKGSALLAGLLMVAIALLTCVSLLGRNAVGVTLAGDFELTGIAAGAAVALFLPWCQLRRGHIIVDFFTARAGERTNARLDRIGALALGAMLAILAWRSTVGGFNALRSQVSGRARVSGAGAPGSARPGSFNGAGARDHP